MFALRIDFRGRGDSEGESIDITPEGDIQDALRAIDFLAGLPRVDSRRLGLVGLSWGGTVAAVAAGRDRRVTNTALWSSSIGDLDWRPEFIEVGGRQAAENWGNLVGQQFYEQLRLLHPAQEARRASGPFLIAYGTADEYVASTVPATRQTLEAAGIPHEVVAIQNADHAFMGYRWEAELIERTVAWLYKDFYRE